MSTSRYALIATVFASLIWGSSFVVNKIGLGFVDPFWFAFLRFGIASLGVLIIAAIGRRTTFSILRSPEVWLLSMFHAGGFLFQYMGMLYTTASKTSLLINASFILVPLVSWIFLQENISRTQVVAIIVGLIGTVLVSTNGDLSLFVQGSLLGDGLIFLAGIIWAIFVVYNKVLVDKGYSTEDLSLGVMTATAVILAPTALALGSTPVLLLPPIAWGILIYTGIVCSLGAYLLWTTGLRHLSVSKSTVILLLEIIWAIILGMIILGEQIGPIALGGAILLLGSFLLVAHSESPPISTEATGL